MVQVTNSYDVTWCNVDVTYDAMSRDTNDVTHVIHDGTRDVITMSY